MNMTKIVQAIVDRIEEKKAVLYFKGYPEAICLPLEMLPENVCEGSLLRFSIKFEHKKTKEERKEISALIKKLSNKQKGKLE